MEEDNDMAAIERLVERFAIPLQGALANTDEIVKEFREMISYATQYIAFLYSSTILFGGGSFMLRALQSG